MKRIASIVLLTLIVVLIGGVVFIEVRQSQGNRKAAEFLAAFEVKPVENLGSTKTLRILPLVDYYTADPALKTEVGVSYLIDTDDRRILFDVGQNTQFESPSPLQSNMKALGIELASVDIVFISHNHLDHVGGMKWQRMNTFSLGTEQLPFPNPRTRVIVPDLMTYPGLAPELALAPMRLGNGVGSTGLASTGAMPRQLVIGWIEEHSLVVNVDGLGGVLIVGCGHQPVRNLIERYEAAFSEPLYGVIGGLHLPVPDGRIHIGPIDAQRRFASGEGLLRPITMADVDELLDVLKFRNLGMIAVGGHDSSDEVIEMVREEFGPAHRYIRVGEEIVISASEPSPVDSD